MIVPAFLVVAVLASVFNTASGCGGCCTPSTWQGVQASQTGYVYRGKPEKVEGLTYVYYDAENRRTAAFANYTSREGPRRYQIVTLYKCEKSEKDCSKGEMYVVDLSTDKCYRKDLERPFRRACVPANASKTGDFYFGAGGDTLAARGYKVEKSVGEYKLMASISVTRSDDDCASTCIPLGETVTGYGKGVAFMSTVGFANIKPSVNPSVFKVPEQCETGTHPALIMMEMHHEYSLLAI